MRIAVVGLGYVGMASAVLLAQRHDVVAVDIDPGRVAAVNARTSPIEDADISGFLATRTLDLRATTDAACICRSRSGGRRRSIPPILPRGSDIEGPVLADQEMFFVD